MQENSYYGFGMTMTSAMSPLPTTPNKQLYNGGSEWQNDYSNSPDYYQTYYRNYDAALGRFVAVDPMAEATESLSVYHYAGNNPINANDPMGDRMNYDFDPTKPGFNQQIGDPWRSSETTTGFTPDYSGPGGGDALLQYDLDFMDKEDKHFKRTFDDDKPKDAISIPPALFKIYETLRRLFKNSDDVTISAQGLTGWKSILNPDFNPFKDDPGAMVQSAVTGFISWGDIGRALGKAVIQAGDNCDCDLVGLSIQGSLVDEVGAGVSLSVVSVTWGKDRGMYVFGTPTVRAGDDNSASVSAFSGWYIGNSSYPNINDFAGHSIDGGTTEGKHASMSFDRYAAPTWILFGQSTSVFGGGASVGYGYARKIYEFKF
jgi:RHS repeat-associated protein